MLTPSLVMKRDPGSKTGPSRVGFLYRIVLTGLWLVNQLVAVGDDELG